jgi:hypothetical protein
MFLHWGSFLWVNDKKYFKKNKKSIIYMKQRITFAKQSHLNHTL